MIFTRVFLLLCLLWAPLFSQGTEAPELTRIVSLSPAITAMLGELGQAHRLVGVTRYCEVPTELRQAVSVVGGAVDPEVESILGLQPDMVIASSLLPENIEERFKALEIPVKRFRQDCLQNILDQVIWLGQHTGNSELAQAEVQRARDQMSNALMGNSHEHMGSGLLVFSETMELVAGGDTYASEVMQLAGLDNAATPLQQSWPVISQEWLLDQDPDWILVAIRKPVPEVGEYRSQLLKTWGQHDMFSQLTAVREGRVIAIPDDRLVVPSLQVFTVIGLLRQQMKSLSAQKD